MAPEKKVKPRPSRIETTAHPRTGRGPARAGSRGGRAGEGHRAEQERDAPAPRVGHDPGRHLEQHHAGGEEGVGGERLEVAEAGVQQEEGVDPPDERGRQGVAQHEGEVDALDLAGGGVHRDAVPVRARGEHEPILVSVAGARQCTPGAGHDANGRADDARSAQLPWFV